MMNLIQQLAYELGPQYGVKDLQGFTEALIAIGWGESGLDPLIIGDSGHSVGAYQLHDEGAGAGMSVEARQNPDTNIRKAISYLGPIYANSEGQGQPWETRLQRMISEGQRPANPAGAYEAAMAAKREAERTSWGEYVAGQPWAPTGGGQAGPQQTLQEWLTSQGISAKDYLLMTNATKQKLEEAWLGITTGETTEPREWQTPEAREAARLGNVETEVGLGLIPYNIDMDEYERQRSYYADQIDAGKLTLDQATNKFNAWMNATAEAGKRAEYVTDIKEKRAQRTLATPFFPTTQPGGELDVLSQRYGLPHTPLAGVPVSSMPSPEAAYEQYRQEMGISAQAPQIRDVTVPTVPTPPQGGSAARRFAEEFLRRAGIQMPVIGGV